MPTVVRCRRRSWGAELRVFISHGSGADGEVELTRKAVVARLTERGYQVFSDVESLRAGDEWNPQLYQEMYRCDAAIVLLGPNTIRHSVWVRRESDVLMGRYVVGSLRLVLPIFIGTQDTAAARARGFGALLAIQAELGRRADRPLPADAAAEAYADWIADEFAPITSSTGAAKAFHDWISRISVYLRVARAADPASAWAVAEALGCAESESLPHVTARIGGEHFLAHLLLRQTHALREDRGGCRLPAALAALRPSLARDQLAGLKNEVMPAWVDPDDATKFVSPQAAGDAAGKPLVILRASDVWTADQHIRRGVHNRPAAFSMESTPESSTMPADEGSPREELLAHCRNALRVLLKLPARVPLTPALARPSQASKEYLVIDALGQSLADVAAVTNTLHAEFPWVTVVILVAAGEEPSSAKLHSLGIARALRVTVPQEVELRAFRTHRELDDVAIG